MDKKWYQKKKFWAALASLAGALGVGAAYVDPIFKALSVFFGFGG